LPPALLFWLVPEALIGLFIDETNVDAADLLAR
jgi:hypothetical protein